MHAHVSRWSTRPLVYCAHPLVYTCFWVVYTLSGRTPLATQIPHMHMHIHTHTHARDTTHKDACFAHVDIFGDATEADLSLVTPRFREDTTWRNSGGMKMTPLLEEHAETHSHPDGYISPRLPETPAGPTEHKARYFMRLAAEREKRLRAQTAQAGLQSYAARNGVNGSGRLVGLREGDDVDRLRHHTERIR